MSDIPADWRRLWASNRYSDSTSTVVGTARLMASETGEWRSAHSTSSCRRWGSTPSATIRTRIRELSGPAGTASSMPRRPRSSDSLSTVTSRLCSGMPSSAARIAITVASQLGESSSGEPPRRGSRTRAADTRWHVRDHNGPLGVFDPAAKSVLDHRGCSLIRVTGLIGMFRGVLLGVLD